MYAWLQRLFSSSNAKSPKQAAAPVKQNVQEVAPPASNAVSKFAAEPVAATPATKFPPASAPAAPAVNMSEGPYGASWEQRNDANANFNDWLFEMNDNSDLDLHPAENEILEAIGKIVTSKQSGANLVKRMPGLIPQLLQSLRTENFSGADLSRKISHDLVLVAAVIRLANGSAYNISKPILSIEHAVLILGQSGLRQLITGVAFRPIIDMNSGHFTRTIAPRLWSQSERCALVNRMLAVERQVDPFEAFLAGLIQHVGLVVSLRIMDQCVEGKPSVVGSPGFCSALLRHARTLSCSIGREWNFPEAVTKAIEEQGSVYNTAAMTPLGKILSLGDYLAKVRMLVDNNRLTEGDPRVLKGLSANAIECYNALSEFEEFDPGNDIKA
jgi:HD-like signal output (HDOD) protein